MAVLNREAYFNTVQKLIGTSTTDDSMHAMEDLIDTYNSLSESNQNSEWKKKYEELDAAWKEKYRHRFFNGTPVPQPVVMNAVEEKEITIDDLFKE